MSDYIMFKTNRQDYDTLILCLSTESLMAYLPKIEAVLAESKTTKRVLIDQLLIVGNGHNRFIGCDFSQDKLNLGTAQIVKPTDFFRKEALRLLHTNYSYVENSILTEEQKQKIKENVVF